MKKLTLSLSLFFILMGSTLLAAPVQQGSASLGLTASFTDIDELDATLASFDYSYLFLDHFGLRLGVDYADLGLDDGTDTVDLTAWIAGLGADYYFTDASGDWATYLGASLLYTDAELESTALSSDLSGDEIGYEARLGFYYFFNERVALDTRLSYQEIDELEATGVSLGLALWF